MRITLEQMRAFERIVRLGSFNAAAESLGLTQPSVSQRIRELESSIGTALFLRRGPKIDLTAAGRALLGYTERILQIEGEIVDRFVSQDPLRGTLRLGSNDSFALMCMAQLVRRLENRYPNLKLSAIVENSTALSNMLNEQELDIAIVSMPSVGAHVYERPIGYNEVGWIGHPKLGFPAGPISARALAPYHIMLVPPPSRLYDSVMNWFAAAKAQPLRVSTCNNLSVIVSSVKQGVAISAMPISVVRGDISAGNIARLDVIPKLPAHRVSICYQTAQQGPGIEAVVISARQLIAENKLFLPIGTRDRG